jgi:FKBP-type peptidyl-prolyl cis-trans isomerase
MKKAAIFLVIAVVFIGAAMLLNGQRDQLSSDRGENTNVTNESMATSTQDTKGLIIEDVKAGTGAEAVAGKTVSVHYVGTFKDGKKFDSSRDRGTPFEFPLGAGRVIAGWDQGVAGMKVGGVRKLTVPPELGYGPNDYGPIPGNSTLLFEVELLGVK